MASEVDRRTLLRAVGALGLGVPLAGFVSSCSTTDAGAPGGGGAQTSQSTLDRARKQGFLRVAIANEPPYTKVTPGGEVTGVSPDIVRAVAKMIGIDDIQGTVTPYESMIPGLNANRWDVIAAGLFMKQSRCAAVAYAEPIIVSTESFGVLPGNPKNLQTVSDVKSDSKIKIAALAGAFEEGILKSSDVPKGQIVSVKDSRSGLEAVEGGRADAFFLPTLSLRDLAKTDKKFEVTDPIEDAPKTGSSAAFRKEDTDLQKAYNDKLAPFKKTDEFAKILTKWGFDPTVVQGVTREELCKNPG